jgi:hypothetical protein
MSERLVDDARWPLVVVNWPAVVQDETLEEMLQLLAGYYGRPHAVLHDGMRARDMSAAQRRRLAQHSRTYEDEVRRWVVASAAVVPSAVLRGIIVMIQWAAPPPSPFRAFGEPAEAEKWLLHALRRAGLWKPAPAARRASTP